MSSSTAYINFSAINYNGVDSLSSYATNLTPLRFVADLPNTFRHRVIWDFGDDTFSKSFSASKVFKFPGKYTIKLIVYDCNNNAMISSIERVVTILDYIPYTFNIIKYLPNSTIEDTEFVLQCGKIEGPFIARSYYPVYQPASSIFYTISGSNSYDFWNIKNNKFYHLQDYNTCYEKIYNYAIKSYQFKEVDKLEFNPDEVYAKISNNSIVLCDKNDSGATVVGLTASKEFYIKDDSVSDKILIDFKFDKTTNIFKSTDIQNFNNLGVTLSCSVVSNSAYKLSITSNGLDGEGYQVDSFNINPIKFFNTKIPFIVKIKDFENFSIKNFNPINLSNISINATYTTDTQLTTEVGEYLLDELGNEIYATASHYPLSSIYYSISSLNYTLSSQNIGGVFRGYIMFPYGTESLLQNVKLIVNGTFINDQLSSFILTGESSYFNVYKSNYYDIWKINEDFNPTETLKDLRFQETLIDKTVLFDDFFGDILGNANSSHESIGIKIYEKISNFISNTQDIDNCEQDFIDSLAKFVGYNDVNGEQYVYPETIKRIINLASIDKSKLIGELNKFKENLDIRGRTSKTEYGINIGDIINPKTYRVDKDTPIVALEKFSNSYTVLNTYQPLSVIGYNNYPLSAYDSTWGWPLVLPTQFNPIDFEKYYIFFSYNSQYDNTPIGGIIDFENTKTTISRDSSYNDLIGENGIFQTMFLDNLYQSLSLIN
jgi:hypothetical protein